MSTSSPASDAPLLNSVLQKLLDSSGDANLDLVASTFGLPRMSEMPRPGLVRAWDFDEWKAWAEPYGLVELPRTTHSYVLCHPKLKMLRVAMSSSTGDVKSRLNLGSDVRQAFRFEYSRIANYCCHLVDRYIQRHEDRTAFNNEQEIMLALRDEVLETRHTDKYSERPDGKDARDRIEAVEDLIGAPKAKAASLKRLLMKASDVTGQPARSVVKRLVALSMSDIDAGDPASREKVAERVYKVIIDELGVRHSSCELFMDALKDIIETHEAIEEEQKRAKLEAREAARAERQKVSKQDAQALVTDDPAAFAKAMADIRGSFLKHTGPLLTTMNEAMTQVRALAEHSASFPSPSYPTAKLAELGTANAMLFERASSLEDQLEDMKTAKDAVDVELKRLKDEHAIAEQMLAEAGTHSDWRGAYAELVTTLDAALASSDFLQLAVGVQTARQALVAAKAKIAQS